MQKFKQIQISRYTVLVIALVKHSLKWHFSKDSEIRYYNFTYDIFNALRLTIAKHDILTKIESISDITSFL